MISFLQKFEVTGDIANSVSEVIDEDWPPNNVYGQLDSFFALFAREKRIGAWKQLPDGGNPYPTILDPNGANISPTLSVTDVPLASGDTYSASGSVSGFGTDYYRFSYVASPDGETFNLSVIGVAGGDYSYYVLWEKSGAFVKAVFPFAISGNYSFSEAINTAQSDSIMIMISGRGNGGAYTINASVS
jgi:hypothetical protein